MGPTREGVILELGWDNRNFNVDIRDGVSFHAAPGELHMWRRMATKRATSRSRSRSREASNLHLNKVWMLERGERKEKCEVVRWSMSRAARHREGKSDSHYRASLDLEDKLDNFGSCSTQFKYIQWPDGFDISYPRVFPNVFLPFLLSSLLNIFLNIICIR